MAFFQKARISGDTSEIAEVSGLVATLKKRVRNLERTERSTEGEINERDEMLRMNLKQDLSNVELIKSEIGEIKEDIKKKSALINRTITELKKCIIGTEFEEMKKKIEKWDPGDMISRDEFEKDIKRRLK